MEREGGRGGARRLLGSVRRLRSGNEEKKSGREEMKLKSRASFWRAERDPSWSGISYCDQEGNF